MKWKKEHNIAKLNGPGTLEQLEMMEQAVNPSSDSGVRLQPHFLTSPQHKPPMRPFDSDSRSVETQSDSGAPSQTISESGEKVGLNMMYQRPELPLNCHSSLVTSSTGTLDDGVEEYDDNGQDVDVYDMRQNKKFKRGSGSSPLEMPTQFMPKDMTTSHQFQEAYNQAAAARAMREEQANSIAGPHHPGKAL